GRRGGWGRGGFGRGLLHGGNPSDWLGRRRAGPLTSFFTDVPLSGSVPPATVRPVRLASKLIFVLTGSMVMLSSLAVQPAIAALPADPDPAPNFQQDAAHDGAQANETL